jgi:hypothetical protein
MPGHRGYARRLLVPLGAYPREGNANHEKMLATKFETRRTCTQLVNI